MAKDLKVKAGKKRKSFKKMLQKGNRSEMVKELPSLHEAAFEKINCLDCAACCKNYSPRFKPPDIRRISKYLGMKEGEFAAQYLIVDNEGDHVVNSKPCPFLDEGNQCSIYEVRPSDCARFPYTDEDVLIDKVALTLKNNTFCPAVFDVLENLEKKMGG
ncbi:MAG: YkgJ family cysteine cluster protein [Saprospirales bacterium]|nr:MAG: YkgJ family cysteine cluster protein [Saprospirales bacterium]